MSSRKKEIQDLYGVILAGGRGERFWPKSRKRLPKQLLSIVGNATMLEDTKSRILRLIPSDRLLVVATHGFEKKLGTLIPDLRKDNLLFEPQGKNTAPAIAYAAETINRRAPQSKMVVLPADHYITDEEGFLKTLKVASRVADDSNLVTFGIVPTRPETAYGYIEVGDEVAVKDGVPVYRSLGFKEKPNHKEAVRFLKAGRYLWNSGMFVWKTEVILKAFEEYMPDLYAELQKLRESLGTREERRVLEKLYEKAPSTSIDYGVMERAPNVAVVKADFPWDDVGSWGALERLRKRNQNGNVVLGEHLGIETKNSLIVSEDDGVVATIGLSDIVVIRVKDATLVCPKGRLQDVKRIVHGLSESKDLEKYL